MEDNLYTFISQELIGIAELSVL